jgi:four helix bundle protein
MSFSHENLHVYQRILAFNARIGVDIEHWDKRHSICDHLPRAATSVVENIAMGSAAYSNMKVKSLDYAVGSMLECAACLDIASVKKLLSEGSIIGFKGELCELLKMLIGLRRRWVQQEVREDQEDYANAHCSEEDSPSRERSGSDRPMFHHEGLDVYRVALSVFDLLSSSASVQNLRSAVFRRLDVLATSTVLNIAEGNGRFSILDQKRFLCTAHESAVKLTTRLDLCVVQGQLPKEEATLMKNRLSRVSPMTSAMITESAPR